MICIETAGGLGNQLFRYAFARAMQLDNGEEIVIYDQHIFDNELGGTERCKLQAILPEDIDVSYVDCPVEGYDSFIRRFAPIRYNINRISRLLVRLLNGGSKKDLQQMPMQERQEVDRRVVLSSLPVSDFWGVYEHLDIFFPLAPRNIFKKKFFDGVFFSPLYFERHENQIRSELNRPELIPERSADLLKKIRSCNAVFVHMRFGDYLSEKWKKNLFVCDIPYFEEAIGRAVQELDDPVFFIFSDSPDIAATVQLPEGAKAVFVPSDHGAVEDLELMAQCKHAIISNSTFSWWGQFLMENPNKRVYAPEPWDRVGWYDTLYQDFWTRIPVELPPL